MRIIAGHHRGRKILPPKGQATRPITDRAKQSLFDILTPLLPNALVYDCFAGTGSLGLESLSRGCDSVTFFESDRSALSLLHANIAVLRLADRSRVIPTDLFQWFASAHPPAPADIIFLDPPYRFLNQRPADLLTLAKHISQLHLAPTGLLIFRHHTSHALPLPSLLLTDSRSYGSMTLDFLSQPPPT